MATYRPYAGYSPWKSVPVTPVKFKISWSKVGVWGAMLTLSLTVWSAVIIWAARVI